LLCALVEPGVLCAPRCHQDTAALGTQVDPAYTHVADDAAALTGVHLGGDRLGQPLAAVLEPGHV
jgi:hypothetical protein